LMPGITVRAAPGAYGGVISKFPQSAPLPATCMITTAAISTGSYEVTVLRRLRDEHLMRTAVGRRIVVLYERLSPDIAERIRYASLLRLFVRWLVVKPSVVVAGFIVSSCTDKKRD
jgi:hypothetical protein